MNRLKGEACAHCGAAIERASHRIFARGLPVHRRCPSPLMRTLLETPIMPLPPEHERLTDHAPAQALVRAAWDDAVATLTREGLYFEQDDPEHVVDSVHRFDGVPRLTPGPATETVPLRRFVLSASENLRYELPEPTIAKLVTVLEGDRIEHVLREILTRHPGAILSTRLAATVGHSDRLREGRELVFIARVWIYTPAAEEKTT